MERVGESERRLIGRERQRMGSDRSERATRRSTCMHWLQQNIFGSTKSAPIKFHPANCNNTHNSIQIYFEYLLMLSSSIFRIHSFVRLSFCRCCCCCLAHFILSHLLLPSHCHSFHFNVSSSFSVIIIKEITSNSLLHQTQPKNLYLFQHQQKQIENNLLDRDDFCSFLPLCLEAALPQKY